MAEPSSHEVTQLLQAWSEGRQEALDQLMPIVERELHRLAEIYMRRERPDHTLQATALVNEAYLKLAHWQNAQWNNRGHFFALAARVMRHILVDHARKKGIKEKVPLEEAAFIFDEPMADLTALDDALKSLEQLDERKGRIVEMRFFAGLSLEEIAEVLDISVRTVIRDWNLAKAWLYRELNKG
jgi:RNA polymerase sigma factor (TIGR02999 family)